MPLSPYKMISPVARFVLAGDRFEDYLVDPEIIAIDKSLSEDVTDATGTGTETGGGAASPHDQGRLNNSDDIFTA
jgi:hypothetical protein